MRKTEAKNRIHDTRVGTFSEKSEENLSEIAKNAAAHTHRGYLSYLFAVFRHGTPYALLYRITAAFSPALLILRALRIAWRILLLVERSALLLLLLGVLLFLLPLLVFLLLLYALFVRIAHRRTDRRCARLFTDQRVVALFSVSDTGYTERLCRALSRSYTVMLVGEWPQGARPSLLSCVLPLSSRCFYVREHYFFHLRRTLLRKSAFFAEIY